MAVIGGDSSSVPPELQDPLNALAAPFSEGEAKGDDGDDGTTDDGDEGDDGTTEGDDDGDDGTTDGDDGTTGDGDDDDTLGDDGRIADDDR